MARPAARSVSSDGVWAGAHATADYLGITYRGLLLLQRDRRLLPDCVPCGRIRWRISELDAARDGVQSYLKKTYADLIDDLLLPE